MPEEKTTAAPAATAATLSPDDPQNWSRLPQLEYTQIGHDSEFFLWDTAKQQVVPSYKYYPKVEEAKSFFVHRKRGKRRYGPKGSGWSTVRPALGGSGQPVKLFRDGLAVEVNTAPVTCRAFMWNDTRGALLRGEPSRMGKNHVFTARPWVPLTDKMMAAFPPDLQQLGCSPSLDAYAQRQNVVAVDPMKTMFRTCGSHLHMSFRGHHAANGVPSEAWSPFIKLADALIGLTHTAIFGDELEAARRKLYGRAGEFRFQAAYGGLEYRVLSSRLWNHQAVYSLLTGIWKYGLGQFYRKFYSSYDRSWESEIQQAINEADAGLALKMLGHTQQMLLRCQNELQYSSIAQLRLIPLTEICSHLREMNLRGFFPDAGVWSRPYAPDGHSGFNDYWATWKTQDPKTMPQPSYGEV